MQEKVTNHRTYPLKKRIFTESTISNSLAVLIGVLTGLAIVLYDRLILQSNKLFFGTISDSPNYYVIFIPALGGLLVGILAYSFVKTRRCDIEEVIEASTLHAGKLRTKNAFLEVLASVITIGSGGSAGKEAPGVLAGAGIGSLIAQIFNISGNRLRIMLGCGASAGIAAAFNAPLAGVVFVVEVIFGELETKTFIPIVISAVFATITANLVFGVRHIQISYYGLVSPLYESVLYLILGLLAGIISALLIRSTYLFHDGFNKIPIHPMLKPAIGGLGVGLIGFFYPQVFGVGYGVITDVLANKFTLDILVILLFLKIITFSLTLGSGGSGGSIVPALFSGAMLGGAFGTVVHAAFPAITAEPGAYALVGMGAVLAGTARAPLTAMLILFELTMDYNIMLPLMFACVVSNVTSSSLHSESIFTEGLRRRGFTIRKGHEIDVMESMLVRDAMKQHVQTVSADKNVGTLISLMQSSRHAGFPVLDQKGVLCGIVTLEDVREKVKYGELETIIRDIASFDVIVAYPDESLNTILERLAMHDIGRLPVVSRFDDAKLLGMITRSDVVNSYNKKVVSKVQKKRDVG
ncbi:MAG TPA: CBS domain-containing protein [Methanosarcinaceae archaeon]|nr:CBS domain-containing protein [Methanosarcinaceae archaeon]